jgi:medium-chain acyl-[acyl-carrier-protein] hydrolase
MADLLRTERWLVRTKARQSSPSLPRLRLFCFPYAGGGASIYRAWSSYLPESIEVCPIYLPGRESRFNEPAFTRISPLVRVLAHVLRPYLDVPFAFFGYSMGALISFELARYLRQAQMPEPAHLFVFAHRAPQLPDRRTSLQQLSDDAFLEKLAQLGGTPQEVLQQTEFMQLMLPTIRADFMLCENYSYTDEPPLTYPITAFGGSQDTMVREQELQAWREQTQGAFALHMFPGDHFFLRDHTRKLVQNISDALSYL